LIVLVVYLVGKFGKILLNLGLIGELVSMLRGSEAGLMLIRGTAVVR